MQSMTKARTQAEGRAPHWSLLWSEPLRAAFEYHCMLWTTTSHQPRGDGHTVVLFPALATDERAMGPTRRFCEALGYVVKDWGWGLNRGPRGDPSAWFETLARHVEAITASPGESVSLIGWSLGGIYAREVAKRMDGRVRQVITIATPFAGTVADTNAALVYELLAGDGPVLDEATLAGLRTPPDVATASIYSRSDGIVPWQACTHADPPPHVDDIEVTSSHCGMPWNPQVLAAIARRLQQIPA